MAHKVPSDPRIQSLLEGARFCDCHRWQSGNPDIEAKDVADALFNTTPRWAESLLKLRNKIGAIFGLRPAPPGGFPVVSQTPRQIVLGFDDWHLDFRIAILVDIAQCGSTITMGTVVRTHNAAGRAYLTLILPFHHLIVKKAVEAIVKV